MLFKPLKLRDIEIQNRIAMQCGRVAGQNGEVSERMISRYRKIAKAGTGLIIPGYMYVDRQGKTARYQTGIHNDKMIPGLKRLSDTVHEEGGRIVFQLHHGGRQCHRSITGMTPIAPSATFPDPVFMTCGTKMNEGQIEETIEAFAQAARRSVEAGADGVQLHGSNGFLINQFLSPFFNRRRDAWGKNPEGRFRFFSEAFKRVRKEVPQNLPVLVKLNVWEHLPGGITPDLA
ncbi:MAG: NADH:flavin oxidoreductase, partial [Desulfobacterales bacterium]